MAPKEDKNFKRNRPLPPSRPPSHPRHSTPRWLNGELTRRIAASAPPASAPSEEEEEDPPLVNEWAQINVSKETQKRVLDIDLNVSPSDEDGGSAPPPPDIVGNEREISPASATVSPSPRLSFDERYDSNMNANEDFIESRFGERQKGIDAHFFGAVANGFEAFAEKDKGKEITISVYPYEENMEKEKRKRKWEELLDVVQWKLSRWPKEEQFRNRRQGKTSRESELSGESGKGSTRAKITTHRRDGVNKRLSSDGYAVAREVVAPPSKRFRTPSRDTDLGGEFRKGSAAKKIKKAVRENVEKEYETHDWEIAAEIPVARSTRGRSVAMPNKYRDSVLDPFAVEEYLRRHGKRKPR